MFSFFDKVSTIFDTVVKFIVNAVKMLVYFLGMIPKALAWIFEGVAYLPTFLGTFVVAPIAVALVFLIIGKDS